jgi:hypothetical protein
MIARHHSTQKTLIDLDDLKVDNGEIGLRRQNTVLLVFDCRVYQMSPAF